MTGLFRRNRRRAAEAPAPPPPLQADVPAGLDPVEATAPPASPSFRDRGRLRRRLRYLRRVRELGFRDLGGLVFDQHRFQQSKPELVEGKLAALAAIDRELRALEVALEDRRPLHELREPGIAACLRCGALHGSDAHFCPSCGLQLSGPRAVSEFGAGGGFPAGTIAASAGMPAQQQQHQPPPTPPTTPLVAPDPPADAVQRAQETAHAVRAGEAGSRPLSAEQPTTAMPPVDRDDDGAAAS
jgi:ribosomal protein L40E